MTSQYSQTWRQLNPAEFIFADFYYPEDSGEKEKSTKKIIGEIIICFVLFILFAYSLSWADQKLNQQQEENQVFEFKGQDKIEQSEIFYHQFQQGYVGQNLIEIKKYKFEEPVEDENLVVF